MFTFEFIMAHIESSLIKLNKKGNVKDSLGVLRQVWFGFGWLEERDTWTQARFH